MSIEMDELTQKEQAKYRKMWDIPKYRVYSPGEEALPALMGLMQVGSTVADFGCGTGRAAERLRANGFMVTGIDFAENCLDEGVDIPFRKECLWELPGDLIFDFGYCTDVMEHIPPSKVNAVLKCIHRATRYGTFFQIATTKDRFGDEIGERLHLSVQPAEVWETVLMKFWPHVRMMNGGRDARFWVSH